jgi:hypothetical protein
MLCLLTCVLKTNEIRYAERLEVGALKFDQTVTNVEGGYYEVQK